MKEDQFPRLICDWLNGAQEAIGIKFVPEIYRDGMASLFMRGERAHVSEYIDGSAVVSVPFEISVRRRINTCADAACVLAVFSGVSEYAKKNSVTCGGELIGDFVERVGAEKKKSCSDGTCEYTAVYEFLYLRQ